MIDEHGINRKYTQHFSFPQDKWERIFGHIVELREELKAQEEEKITVSIPASDETLERIEENPEYFRRVFVSELMNELND